MQKPPSIEKIKKWLIANNPCGFFSGEKFTIKDIDPKPWSGHFNFLAETGKQKFIIRFKGPEWGESSRGIIDEFNILKYVEPYKVGPKPFSLSKNFFGEPMMLEEYLNGRLLNTLSPKRQRLLFPKVAQLIAKINSIPFNQKLPFFRRTLLDYKQHKKIWRERLKICENYSPTKEWVAKIKFLLPKAERMLDVFEKKLQKIIRKNKVFIFKSSHLGHCLMIKRGLRFLNWEQASFGDPSFTLSVFLASIRQRSDFEEVKREMIKTYLKNKFVPQFAELVEQRLAERAFSNMIWVLWSYAVRQDRGFVEKASGVEKYYNAASKILFGF